MNNHWSQHWKRNIDSQAEVPLIESQNDIDSQGDIDKALEHLESGKAVILHQDGKAIAALISIEDLHLLE